MTKGKKLTLGNPRKWLGVCAGIGEYFGIDPTLVRVIWIVITIFSSFVPGIIGYLLMAWVMPEKS